ITIPAPTDAPPVVDSIVTPTAATVAEPGRAVDVAWTAHDDLGVITQEVWYSTDDGAHWTEIVGDVPGDKTRYRWIVPTRMLGDKLLIKVVARDASVQRGELVSPAFRVVRPSNTRLPSRTTDN